MPDIKEIKFCRVCQSKELTKVLSLGNDFYISTFVKKEGDNLGKAPLVLVECQNCKLVQLKHSVPLWKMFKNHYWFKSGINEVIVRDLADVLDEAMELVDLKDGDIFLDIGANDGTLLSFVPNRFISIGCEPADNLIEELKKNCDYYIHDFWDKKHWQWGKAKIVTAIGMAYDMEDPTKFFADIKAVMDDDGILIAQMMTLKPMYETADVANICHEHLEYYSYKSLKYMFEKAGLEIFKIKEVGINGVSYRIYAHKLKRGSIDYPEPEYDWSDFKNRIENNRSGVLSTIFGAIQGGKKVYGYGASTKGNTTLQWYGLNKHHIVAIADRNPEKHGLIAVGSWIPVISEEEARKNADYFLILPWGFRNAFKEREEDFLVKGGRFIIHTPRFELI